MNRDTVDFFGIALTLIVAVLVTTVVVSNLNNMARRNEFRKLVDAGIGYYEVDKYGKSTFKYFANTNYVVIQ